MLKLLSNQEETPPRCIDRILDAWGRNEVNERDAVINMEVEAKLQQNYDRQRQHGPFTLTKYQIIQDT